MARFRFKAATAGGEVLEGEVEAPTRVAAVDRSGQAAQRALVARDLILKMRHAERYVPGFILRRELCDPSRDGIRRVMLKKPEQVQKGPFAQDR